MAINTTEGVTQESHVEYQAAEASPGNAYNGGVNCVIWGDSKDHPLRLQHGDVVFLRDATVSCFRRLSLTINASNVTLETELTDYDDTRINDLKEWYPGEDEMAFFGVAPHANAVAARLEEIVWQVRTAALVTLGELETATLAKHADAVVQMLEDSNGDVRAAATQTMLPGSIGSTTHQNEKGKRLAQKERGDMDIFHACVIRCPREQRQKNRHLIIACHFSRSAGLRPAASSYQF